jgi:GT2 family glycosyltransferase
MNGRDSVHGAELAHSLRQLAEARRRLEEVRAAYAIVENSRFALLRRAFRSLKGVAGLTRVQPLIVTGGAFRAPASNTSVSPDAELPNRLREAERDRAMLLEAMLVQRAKYLLGGDYETWLSFNGVRSSDISRMSEMSQTLPRRVVISVIMTTFETPERFLREAIESVRSQAYPYWELCIADDASTQAQVRKVLEEYSALDHRIKVVYRNENGHIARASNSALELATGEFVGFLDHDDTLSPDALFEMALAINRFPDVDMLYSDEDKIDETGVYCDPHFKPDWSPDSFLSRMYTCHFSVYRRSLVEELGGLRAEFSGSQDYDLVLRLTERTGKIHHIPRVLYHWRKHSGSASGVSRAKPYSSRAAERAIAEALERRDEPGTVSERADTPGVYIVRYAIREPKRVSVIVPTRDHGEDVDRCLSSLFAKAGYDDLEVILLDNGSTEKSSLATFARWAKKEPRVNVVRYDVPFNFSRINNYAVTQSTGHYLLFLNNDTEAKSEGWIAAMVEQAQRPSIGAVGALLLYPDNTVQHAGVVIGLGGVAGHSHKHFSATSNGHANMLKAVNNYSAVTGACLMTRREVFERVGGLDEELTVAFNDIDLCLKIVEAGYRIVNLPHVQLYHFESKSRGHDVGTFKIARSLSEQAKMRERWGRIIAHDPSYSPHLTLDREDYSIRVEIV